MADEDIKADLLTQEDGNETQQNTGDSIDQPDKDGSGTEIAIQNVEIQEEGKLDSNGSTEQNVEKDKDIVESGNIEETNLPIIAENAYDDNHKDVDNEDKSVSEEMGESHIQQIDKHAVDEDETMESVHMPINDAIPEEEEGEVIEISHLASRDPTPHQMEEDSLNHREIPDAYSTPPPPQKEEDHDVREYQEFYDAVKEHGEHGYSPEYPLYDRSQLLERYKEALEERSQLDNTNNQLQHKLAEYFKKKKTDERVQEVEKNVTDQEQRYLKYISNLEELQNEEKRQEGEIRSQIGDLKLKCQERQGKVDIASNEYMQFKYDIAKSSINSRSGKQIPVKDIELFQAAESKKEQEVIQVRLENIKLKNRLRKKEQQLKAKEELAEGLHLIDFEQLKIENQTYNEKIEERNEEILKLRKKITTTVQVLTHLKEKLQFVQGENCEQRGALKLIDSTVAQKRDILTRTKQVRDALRIDNTKLKQKCGLLGNEALLRDFELRKDEGDDLGQKLNGLRTEHVGLSMNLNGVKKKIRQTRNNSA